MAQVEQKVDYGKQRDKQMSDFILKTVELTLGRIKKYNDPVLRYTLLLDKFRTLLELGFTASVTVSDFDDNTKHKLEKVFGDLQVELDLFADYIRTPHLAPDHPVGNNILRSGEVEFKRNG